MSYDYLFKFVIIGDANVGKSACSDRFVDDKYIYNYDPTIGVDFKTKQIILDDNTVIKTHLWDTAGHEKFSPIVKHYYKGLAGFILIFDVTSRRSFNRLHFWLNKIKNLSTHKDGEDVPILLLGNKIDKSNREISNKEATEFALNYGLLYEECSAKKGTNILGSFKRITNEIYSKLDKTQPSDNPGIRRHFSFNDNIQPSVSRDCSNIGYISRMCCTLI